MTNISVDESQRKAEVSMFRLYVMRLIYLINFVLVGFNAWAVLIKHEGAWDPVRAGAFCFWAALGALSGLGLRYPLKMLPLLLLQLLYKSIWLIAAAPGLWYAGSTGSIKDMAIGVVLDLIAIPWPYVIANYVKKPGDRWR
jgi:hypothetical protein